MRVKIKASASGTIVKGPGHFLIRNKTNGTAIWVDVANYPETGEPVPAVTEAAGFEIPKVTTPEKLEVALGPEEALVGIVKTGEAEQELEVLRTSPKL